MNKYVFKLYVAGQTAKSRRAAADMRQLCEEAFPNEYSLAVIDVLEDPEAAEHGKILATPTLVKESPPPVRYLIGDLSHHEKVLSALGIS